MYLICWTFNVTPLWHTNKVYNVHLSCLGAVCLCLFGGRVGGCRVISKVTIRRVTVRLMAFHPGPLCVTVPPQQRSSVQASTHPPQPQPAFRGPGRPHSKALGQQGGQQGHERWGSDGWIMAVHSTLLRSNEKVNTTGPKAGLGPNLQFHNDILNCRTGEWESRTKLD